MRSFQAAYRPAPDVGCGVNGSIDAKSVGTDRGARGLLVAMLIGLVGTTTFCVAWVVGPVLSIIEVKEFIPPVEESEVVRFNDSVEFKSCMFVGCDVFVQRIVTDTIDVLVVSIIVVECSVNIEVLLGVTVTKTVEGVDASAPPVTLVSNMLDDSDVAEDEVVMVESSERGTTLLSVPLVRTCSVVVETSVLAVPTLSPLAIILSLAIVPSISPSVDRLCISPIVEFLTG